jgi:hypothetical protein
MPKPPADNWREQLSRWNAAQSGDKMAKPEQDVFPPDPALIRPLTPRIEIALTVPDGVDIQITVNGVGVLMQDDDDEDAA